MNFETPSTSGKLYILATPIGNLSDITLRGLDTLKTVDLILCEDTRVTSKLLAHFKISKPLLSYHHHSDERRVEEIIHMLTNGKNIALVTDAGTPGISDPGNQLIAHITRNTYDVLSDSKKVEQYNNITIIPVPGVSALITALSISGFSTDKFVFMGFPPHKKGRKKFFDEVSTAGYTVVFYESNHRIKKCLNELVQVLDSNRNVCICRELTKKFETIYRGSIQKIVKLSISEKGEFVIVIEPVR